MKATNRPEPLTNPAKTCAGLVAVSWFVAEEPDDRFEKLDGALCSMAGRVASVASLPDVEGVVEGCVVVGASRYRAPSTCRSPRIDGTNA
jgi:hypothetical protein